MSAQRNLRIAVAVGIFVLTACASGQPVYLEGPDGQTAQCGPTYPYLGFFLMERGHETTEELRRKCIADYEGRGFRQVPAPPREKAGDPILTK